MTADATIFDFIDSPELLLPWFEGASWDRWRAVLRGAFALPMSQRDLELFQQSAGGRDPPTKPVREFVCCIGRGGGKDSVAAALAIYLATTCNTSSLRPGQYADILCLASDKDQASIAFDYVRALFDADGPPLLRGMVKLRSRKPAITDDTIELTNRARIRVQANSKRGVRGRTYCAVIMDELAFWYNQDFINADVEVDAAVSPGLARFPGSLKIMISSVNKKSGLLYDKFSTYFGTNDEHTLVVRGTTVDFNPLFDRAIMDAELERDPEKMRAEYLSEWRLDLSNPFDRDIIESAVDVGCRVRPRASGTFYTAFADASSGHGDAFALAISHQSPDGHYILDLLWEKQSPFNVETAVYEAAQLLRDYGLSTVTGDAYSIGFMESGFQRYGISYQVSERNKSELYLEVLPLFSTGRVRLLDNKKLTHQYCSLERRVGVLGREQVSHPDYRNARDDLSNAASGALVLCREGAVIDWGARYDAAIEHYKQPSSVRVPSRQSAVFF